MTKSLLILLTICSLSILSVAAQNFPTAHYGVEDGLPSNKVYEIYRDSKGFLWMATDKGVARYNGIKFEVFTTLNGLSDNEVFYFQEDHYGRIWLATLNGRLCYYQDGVFHNETNTPFLKLPFKTNYSSFINLQRDSSVMIAFSSLPYIVNISKDKIKTVNIKNEHNENILSKIRLYNQWDIKRFAQPNLYNPMRVKKNNDSIFEMLYPNIRFHINKYSGYICDTVFKFEREKKYVTFSQNVKFYFNDSLIYDENDSAIHRHPPHIKRMLSAFISHIWFRIYRNSGSYFYIANDALYRDSTLILKREDISSIVQDVAGNYWFSTLNDGIFSMDSSFNKQKFHEEVYTSKIKYSCIKDNKLFYASDYNNIYCFDSNKATCLYNYQQLQKGIYKRPSEPAYMLCDNYKLYYFYDIYHGVIDNIFSKKTASRKYVTFRFGVKSIYRVNDQIYFNDAFNVLKLDYKKLRADDTIGSFGLSDTVDAAGCVRCDDHHASERILSSAQANNNDIWFSTFAGLYKVVDCRSKLQHQFKDAPLTVFNFLNNCLVGYFKNTIYVYNGFDNIAGVDSIIDKSCIWDKFYKIDSNHLLISTNNYYRVLTLYPSNGRPKYDILTVENQLIPLRAESICSDGNNCYFFKNGALTSINVAALYRKPEKPVLYFSSLSAGERALYAINNECTIPFDQAKNILLSFQAVSFSSRAIIYQYSISKNGIDNWNSINGTEIPLINSNYGNYIIKVRAKTLSSDYSAPIVFSLHIKKPYWATWWFISLIVIAVGIIIAILVRRRLAFAIAKRESVHNDKVKFMKSEYKALNALMNPHFIFNTLNNVQSLVNGNDKLAANEYLRIFADLVRQNMHNVSKELIPLQKEIDLVINYLLLEKLRFEDRLDYKLNIDEDLELYDIMVPPLLIQPLVENSIKHGILPLKSGKGFIEINIREQDGMLIMEIKDNGVGLNNSKQKAGSLHESFGLDNIRKRIEQLSIIQGKEITFSMGNVTDEGSLTWTIATITMPI